MKQKPGPGFAVLYRWRLIPGKESQFIEAWSRISETLLTRNGSLGSRLHRGSDGIWYSYAQWPSSKTRTEAFARPNIDLEARNLMRDAIAEELPEIILESISDYMVLPTNTDA